MVYSRVKHCSLYLPLMIFLLIYYLREETGDCPSNCREKCLCRVLFLSEQAHVLCSAIVFLLRLAHSGMIAQQVPHCLAVHAASVLFCDCERLLPLRSGMCPPFIKSGPRVERNSTVARWNVQTTF